MSHHQITSGERYMISALRKHGHSRAAIARTLGRHRSTIGRELRRNACRHGWYRPSVAVERTSGRRSRSRRNRRFSPADLARVAAMLARRSSPEQVAGYMRRTGELPISHETIYRYIWQDRRAGGRPYQCLRVAHRQRRKRYGAYDSRGGSPANATSPTGRPTVPAGAASGIERWIRSLARAAASPP